MTIQRYRDFAPLTKLPSTWTDGIEGLLTNYVSPNFQMKLGSPTAIQIPAGAGDSAVSVAIDGKPRWIETSLNITHPGGAAGPYNVYVTGAVDAYSTIATGPSAGAEQDDTDHAFYGVIIDASGGPPSGTGTQAIYRLAGQCIWDGSAIISITQNWAPIPTLLTPYSVNAYSAPLDPAGAVGSTLVCTSTIVPLTFAAQVRDLPNNNQFTPGGSVFTCQAAGLYHLSAVAKFGVGSGPPPPTANGKAYLLMAVDSNTATNWASLYYKPRFMRAYANKADLQADDITLQVDAFWELAAGEQVSCAVQDQGTVGACVATTRRFGWHRIAA